MMSSARIAFVGLGRMGGAMASRLLTAGFTVSTYDIRSDVLAELARQGASAAGSPGEAVAAANIVATSLPGPREAEKAFLGDDGIVNMIAPGAVCIDFTTNAPALVKRLAAALKAKGAELLDAPVSGGVEAARQGTLTVLVGGDPTALSRCEPMLQSLAKTVLHVGDVGMASICKVLHNCAVFCANLATIECLTVGVKAGVPARTLIDVFQKSGLGRNLDLNTAMPATLFQGNFAPRFLMSTALKDMSLATELARQVEAPMPMAALCEQDMAEAVMRGWGSKDNTIFLTLQEERAGVKVRLAE
jgi:3-hydroxyisobutyrate dehydrogenase